MRPHRVVVLDVLTKHPPQMPFVDGDDVIEALAPERPDHPLGDGVGVRCAQRSQNRLDPDPSSACDEVPAIATVAVSDEEPWLLTPGGRLDHLPPDPGRDRVLRDVPVPDAAPAVVDHDEHVERAEGEGLHREQVSSPDAGRVVAQKRAPRLTRRSPERLLTVAAHGASADVEAKRTQLTNDADGAPPWIRRCAGSAAATRRECGDAQVRDDSSSASRRAKQNDATAQPCPARPSRACLASRTNRVPVVTRIGGRGDKCGAPGRIRTLDPQIRSLMLSSFVVATLVLEMCMPVDLPSQPRDPPRQGYRAALAADGSSANAHRAPLRRGGRSAHNVPPLSHPNARFGALTKLNASNEIASPPNSALMARAASACLSA